MPAFESDDVVDDLSRYLESLINSHETITRTQEALARSHEQLLAAFAAVSQASDDRVAQRKGLPALREWRTYEGFRDDMRRREAEWLQHNDPPVSKLALANQTKSDTERTITRTMRRYHLHPTRDWPPSTWPDDEPEGLDLGHTVVLVSAGVFGFGLLDVISDGRLDGVVRVCRMLLGHGQN